MRTALVVMLILVLAASASAATYYVDNTGGDNANDGLSVGAAWQTTQHACSTLVAGDTVFIRSGWYDENSRGGGGGWGVSCQKGLVTLHSGTASDPIVLKGYPGDEKPIIVGKNDEIDGSGINRSAANLGDGERFIVYDSLEFRYGFGGIYIWLGSGVHDITIKYCTIDSTMGCSWDNNNGAVLTYGGADEGEGTYHIVVDHCEIFANGGGYGTSNSYTRDFNTSGIHNYSCDSCTFSNNEIHDENAGISLKGSARYSEIYGNTIYNCPEAAMIDVWGRCGNCSDMSGTRWHHNVSYNCGNCFLIGQGSNSQGEYDSLTYFYNNTCDCTNAQTWGAYIGMSIYGGIQSDLGWFRKSFIFNNIIYNPPSYAYGATDDHRGAITLPSQSSATPSLYFDYNAFYGQGDANYYYLENAAYTVSGFRAATPSDTTFGGAGVGVLWEQADHDTIADPDFADAANHDYHLNAGSWAGTAGKGGSFTFYPDTRDITEDLPSYMGAFDPDIVQYLSQSVTITDVDTVSATINIDFAHNWGTIARVVGIWDTLTPPTTRLDSVDTPTDPETIDMTGLDPSTTYYVRCIAWDDSTTDTSDIDEFTTDASETPPVASGSLIGVLK